MFLLEDITPACYNFVTARKVPLLIFSGGNNGHVSKWERLQSNNFMYR